MSQVSDLIALLALAAVAGTWLKSSRARERAVDEARRQCAQHGLQLLDETVGLNDVRLRRAGGRRRLEFGYAFEVSLHGDDRQGGRLWMHGGQLVGLSLPSMGETLPDVVQAAPAMREGNVVPFRSRPPHIEE
jgi:hypothetical protein